MLILKTFCVKCGNDNTDWKKYADKDELITCFKCNTLYEIDFSLITVTTTESLRSTNQVKK